MYACNVLLLYKLEQVSLLFFFCADPLRPPFPLFPPPPQAALFYYYRATQPGLDLACQSQYECMGVPLFGILLTVLTLNFLVGPFVQRAMRSSIISSVPIISGAERVLMLPARRGFFAAGVAKRLTTGTITCVDCWTTRFLPEDGKLLPQFAFQDCLFPFLLTLSPPTFLPTNPHVQSLGLWRTCSVRASQRRG